ncbi:TCP-1/cpn60 chaperonin family protein [Infirmifilum lucidum]|uniref:Thermosome subunit beta n=1 Tax=Infirmifilum lucidum TaxID=2776706 RepID=A0A7L9FLB6_9CREN|nr:thermosome subunit beta [Infirmifilum lucidum]QOJ79625.1 TCP-1/cpn60 chaperonin family protein [Infirmifilum lucidum]
MASVAQLGGVPVLILKEGSTRQTGREALHLNIMVARAIAETVKTTLGPKGMDKMLIDTLGDITISNDGATILDEMDVQHPVAKLMVEVAKAQDKEVGDGTTTAVVLTGELLKEAERLLDRNIHPTIIVSGYKKAMEKAREVIRQKAIKVSLDDVETLKKVAATSMRSKAVAALRDYFAELAVKAVKQVAEEVDGQIRVDIDNIQVIKKKGGAFLDTQLVYGIIVDKEVVHPAMPKRVEKAKIALLDAPLEVEKTEIDAEIRISSPEQMQQFLEEEEKILKEMVEKIKESGANVVFCQKGIDDVAQYYLAKAGILAVRRVKKSDMEKLARATGAKILTRVEDVTPEALGTAELVEERKVADEKMVFVEGCPNPKSVTILVRGGFERAVDEAERSLKDALHAVADVLKHPYIVPGGGAVEAEIARELRKYATEVGGKEQLAIEAFANAIEAIPRILAENAGLDPIDIMADLRSAHEDPSKWGYGVDVVNGGIADMIAQGIFEPAAVKEHAIKIATEAASMILRIDDIISASKLEEKKEEKKKEEGEEKEKSEFD